MGRNSDKLYLTAKEHAEGPRGYKGPGGGGAAAATGGPAAPPPTQQAARALLPLTHCALTLQPWRDPVCAPDGAIFDITAAMPYVRKHGKHPITGVPMTVGDLTPLNFSREGGSSSPTAPLCCPVTGRVFTTSSRLVAVRPTGNVFAAEAVEELCAATRNWRDLLTDEPFAGRKDLIELRPAAAGRTVGPAAATATPAAAAAAASGAQRRPNNAASSDDVKRALAALGTAEASAAMARGGGGAAMEAARLAAEARLKEQRRREEEEAKRRKGDDDDDEQPEPQGDWRLRGEAPRARADAAVFKPGAKTWDTTSYMGDAAALRRAERQREVQAIVDSGGLLPERPAAAGGGGGDSNSIAAAEAAAAAARGANPATLPDGTPRPVPRVWYVKHSGHARFETGVETTGAAARSLTSTVAPATARNALVRRRVSWKPPPGTKAYVRLSTSHGDLNLELHADACPLACENFLALCEMGYYDGVGFHRLVRNFVLQGGDPTETGKGGESIFSATTPGGGGGGGVIGGAAFFPDEIDARLKHDGRGVLAMANQGARNTNGSQFYVTLKSAPQLDGKHTVFGRVVGGMETLSKIERQCCDDADARERPKERVEVTGAKVFVNPFLELARQWDEEHAAGGDGGGGGGGGGQKRPAEAEAALVEPRAPAAAAAAEGRAAVTAAAPPPAAGGAPSNKKRAAPSAFDAW